MTSLDTLLQDLGQADAALAATPPGEMDALAAILEQRAAAVQQAAHALSSGQATPEQRDILIQSHQTGSQALRQLILARHMLSTELSLLDQEQRLWDNLSSHLPRETFSLNLIG